MNLALEGQIIKHVIDIEQFAASGFPEVSTTLP